MLNASLGFSVFGWHKPAQAEETMGQLSTGILLSTLLLAGCADGDARSNGDAMSCPKQPYRHLESPDFDAGENGASYVSLATLCQGGCPASEADLIERMTCRAGSLDASATGVDAGDAGVPINGLNHWTRVEGCGLAQVRSPFDLGGIYYTFALDGGALVGKGSYDDVPIRINGSLCEDNEFVAGLITPACPDASVLHCDRKR
jgi:hypothetical protein